MGVDHRRTALIVGAGIGGLAAGIALGRAGWDIRIFERAPTPRDIGFALGSLRMRWLPCAVLASPTPSAR